MSRDGAYSRAHDRRAEKLVFTVNRQNFVRSGNVNPLEFAAADLRGALFVFGVDVAVEKTDRHRLDLFFPEAPNRRADIVLVERGENIARVQRPLPGRKAQRPRHQRAIGRHEPLKREVRILLKPRRMSSVSRNPSVVSRPTLAVLPVSSAFLERVVHGRSGVARST